MNVAEIKFNDIANGEGVRTSLFVSGCRHHCPECFNAMTWDFNYGREFTEDDTEKIIEATTPSWVTGLSILGGEPFEPENQEPLIEFLEKFKCALPEKDIWCYSGFTFDEITGVPNENGQTSRAFTENSAKLLSLIDVLVDGRFIKELKNIRLKFRGSENQRVINVKKTLRAGKIVLYLE